MSTKSASATGEMATVQGERSLKERGNLFEVASQQVHKAADAIKLDPSVAEILAQPKNES